MYSSVIGIVSPATYPPYRTVLSAVMVLDRVGVERVYYV